MYKGDSFSRRSGASHSRPFNGGTGARPFHSHNSGNRSRFSRYPHRSRGGGGGRRRTPGAFSDVSKFINKAVITETAPSFVPEHAFADFAVDERLKKAVVAKGYITPTPIQDRAIPHVLRGSDVVGIANTGTGKTAAFLIPLIEKVLKSRRERVLVMVPTRELAIQIDAELRAFAKDLGVLSACVVGGASIGPQLRDLRRHPNFVIGTPGRLKDILERRALDLKTVRTVVLDEADRMLDMGFIADMRFIMRGMPLPRHTLFFSATLSSTIEQLIGEFLTQPVRISVKTGETPKDVDQDVVRVGNGGSKLDVLHDLLVQPEFNKVLIFGRTKHGVEKLSKMLAARGFKAESIHGNKTHNNRQKALGLFKQNHIQILVATDVAARGLDIESVSHVINYDLPTTYDDYVHRIGRTGRAGKRGKALTFVE